MPWGGHAKGPRDMSRGPSLVMTVRSLELDHDLQLVAAVRVFVTVIVVPEPATLVDAHGFAGGPVAVRVASRRTSGSPAATGPWSATPLRWKVTASVVSWPKVASNGWRRLPSIVRAVRVVEHDRRRTGVDREHLATHRGGRWCCCRRTHRWRTRRACRSGTGSAPPSRASCCRSRSCTGRSSASRRSRCRRGSRRSRSPAPASPSCRR